MTSFKFFWNAHKWTGLCVAAFFLCTATTGFLLLIKKNYEWIQPPTMEGASGEIADFISSRAMFDAVLALELSEFQSDDDVDRVDFRPGDRVFKVQSKHNYMEVQIDAVTGEVLYVDWRPSDMLEDMHDGSYWGGWVHAYVMPLVPIALTFLVFSGIWLWVEPLVRRRRRLKLPAKVKPQNADARG